MPAEPTTVTVASNTSVEVTHAPPEPSSTALAVPNKLHIASHTTLSVPRIPPVAIYTTGSPCNPPVASNTLPVVLRTLL